MLWIGITGPMGSGKSTVANELRGMGYPVLDADQIATQAIGPGSTGESFVFKTFGEQVRGPDGKLDRRALGRLVFSDKTKLIQLEALIHPLVREEVARQRLDLANRGMMAAFYDVPLLYEKSMQDQFDHVLVVSAPQADRHARLKARSGLEEAEIVERTRHHISESEKERLASAVIRNVGGLTDLKKAVVQALQSIGVPSPASTQS